MKRKMQSFFSILLAVTLSAILFVACQKSDGTTKAEVVQSTESVVVIRVDEVEGEASLYDVMCELKESGKFDFVSEDSAFGQSIVSINGVENPADWSSYWASYTTDSENGNTEQAKSIDGVNWYYAMLGISSLKVKAGASYMFRFEKSTY